MLCPKYDASDFHPYWGVFWMAFKAKIITTLSVLLLSNYTFAGRYFDNLRLDSTVPEHCRETKPRHFAHSDEITFFTVSINGAKNRGFDYEYPGDRHHMAMLYKVFRDNDHNSSWFRQALNDEPVLREHYEILMNNYASMGFEFKSEGEILELLAIDWIQNSYDENEVFVTGSVVYHNSGQGQTIGELDLMLASSKDCTVFSVGEAKLGTHSLGKARRQLSRFQYFLKTTIKPFLENSFSVFSPKFKY